MSIKEINEKTSLPFKIVVPIMTAFIGCTWVGAMKLSAIENAIARQWTTDNQARWSNKLRAQNPTLSVPYTEDVMTAKNERNQNEH